MSCKNTILNLKFKFILIEAKMMLIYFIIDNYVVYENEVW